MKFTTISSGSEGNCYLLENEKETLVIEAGVPFKRVLKSVDFNVNKIAGVLISHVHGDHAKYSLQYAKRGIKIYTTQEVRDVISGKFPPINVHLLGDGLIQIGGFKIKAFPVLHDVETYGFFIHHKDMGNLVFITDTYTCEYVFPGVNHWVVEANYSKDLLTYNIDNDHVKEMVARRVASSHFEVNNLIKYLKKNDLSNTCEIILIHLSKNNADLNEFKGKFAKDLGLPVQFATPHKSINLTPSIF